MTRLWLATAIALLSCKSKDDVPPPTPSSAPADPCAHPIPLTIGVQAIGDLGGKTQCWSFDGIANASLVLDVELRSEAPVDVSFAEHGSDVCQTTLDAKKAPWGAPFKFECAFPRTTSYQMRMRGTGGVRFTLKRRD